VNAQNQEGKKNKGETDLGERLRTGVRRTSSPPFRHEAWNYKSP